jgi:hypothetical protein
VVDEQPVGVTVLLTYPISQKSTVDTYTYILYEDGNGIFAYTDAPNRQEDGYGTTGLTAIMESSYLIALVDPLLLLGPGIKPDLRITFRIFTVPPGLSEKPREPEALYNLQRNRYLDTVYISP